jgi:hypothetical protein
MKSERTRSSRSSRPCPKLNGRVAGLTLEDPAKVLFVIESASIADLLDAQVGAAQQFPRGTDFQVQTILVRTRAGVFAEGSAKARVADIQALRDIFKRHVAGLLG